MPTSKRLTRNNASPKGHTFPKAQRLCSRKLTEQLFASGNRTLSAFPLRVVFMVMPAEDSQGSQVLMSVSKRLFKHAVDRNRCKRQMREAWRLSNDILFRALPETTTLVCAFIWTSRDLQPTPLVQRKMQNLLHRMSEQIVSTKPVMPT